MFEPGESVKFVWLPIVKSLNERSRDNSRSKPELTLFSNVKSRSFVEPASTNPKSKEIGEDEEKSSEKNVQSITDDHFKTVDEKVSLKEKEIMTI